MCVFSPPESYKDVSVIYFSGRRLLTVQPEAEGLMCWTAASVWSSTLPLCWRNSQMVSARLSIPLLSDHWLHHSFIDLWARGPEETTGPGSVGHDTGHFRELVQRLGVRYPCGVHQFNTGVTNTDKETSKLTLKPGLTWSPNWQFLYHKRKLENMENTHTHLIWKYLNHLIFLKQPSDWQLQWV